MKGKRMAAIVLSLATVMALTPVASAFSDIKGLKGEKHILQLKERGVIKGDAKGKGAYHPQDKLSYAQAAVMLDEAFELSLAHILFVKEPKASDVYTKVKDNTWYSQAFVDGYHNGLIFDKDINPNAPISREEFAAQLMKQVDRLGDYALIKMYVGYTDEDKGKDEYKGEIQKLLLLKFAELNKDGSFNPTKPITREDAAIWVSNALKFVEEQFGDKEEEQGDKQVALSELTFKTEKINDDVNKVTVSATVPHPGYGMNISEISFEGDVAIIKLTQVDPNPDMMYPQVISTVTADTYISSQYKIKLIAE
ncbi:S-layer homology domain-containing protein [Paenibacillus septentrionalis]|uniref:S-layer homology domain-containing protein n=1 Tax=Paenibacillus septentrionalis TaxID=429342 RepID=A0ABW1V047_9BACL